MSAFEPKPSFEDFQGSPPFGDFQGSPPFGDFQGSRDAQGAPTFAEPWQAQAFALAIRLSETGHFTPSEWSAALGAELRAAAERGEPDHGSRYYEHWLAALERLVTSKGLTDSATLAARKDEWEHAYRKTPHGQPVELRPLGEH